ITVSPSPAYRRRVPPSTRMTSARLAPELSATRTMVSDWIMAQLLTSAVDDLDHAPPLVLRQRARLHDAHRVAGLRVVLLVVRFHLRGARDHLAVARMREASLQPHHHGLLHLVAYHDPQPHLARAARWCGGLVGRHAFSHSDSILAYLPDDVRARPGLVRSRSTVLRRAISLRTARSRNGSSSGFVAPLKRRLNRSSSRSPIRVRMSASVISLMSVSNSPLAIGRRLLAGYELRAHGDLGRRQRHRLLGDLARDAFELEQHPTRLHHGHPSFRRPLALPHARLGRLLRDRFVREDADPDLAAALDVTGERHARSLDLPVGDPAGLHGLESVGAERNLGPTGRQTLGASLEHLPEFYSLRTEHCSITR